MIDMKKEKLQELADLIRKQPYAKVEFGNQKWHLLCLDNKMRPPNAFSMFYWAQSIEEPESKKSTIATSILGFGIDERILAPQQALAMFAIKYELPNSVTHALCIPRKELGALAHIRPEQAAVAVENVIKGHLYSETIWRHVDLYHPNKGVQS